MVIGADAYVPRLDRFQQMKNNPTVNTTRTAAVYLRVFLLKSSSVIFFSFSVLSMSEP